MADAPPALPPDHATDESLVALSQPRSVAVIGASPKAGSIGGSVFANILDGRFNGPAYPVHPTAHSVASVRAYPTILDVPDEIDLAIIVVPAPAVPEAIDQCVSKGVRAVVVLSAGFAEIGDKGRALQDRVLSKVRASGIRMVGPNCLGVINTDPT